VAISGSCTGCGHVFFLQIKMKASREGTARRTDAPRVGQTATVFMEGRAMAKKESRRKSGGQHFVTVFRHYRTGKLMYAKDYGLKAWPLQSRKPKGA
jgi:hypothetical protein